MKRRWRNEILALWADLSTYTGAFDGQMLAHSNHVRRAGYGSNDFYDSSLERNLHSIFFLTTVWKELLRRNDTMAVNNSWWQLVKGTLSAFFEDKAPRLGAALAFYTTFSVAPLLVMSAAAASLFFGTDAVEGHLKHELIDFVGDDAAEGIQGMVAAAQKAHHSGMASSVVGILALFFGAMGVFIELKASMNTIWGVEVRPELGLWGYIVDSALAYLMVVAIAFLLLISMILTAFLLALSRSISNSTSSVELIDFVVSSIVITLLFMLIFKYLPDAKILWKDVWIGALVTAVLFTIGKHLVGIYLATAVGASAYGAVRSIAVFLLWTYYSSQILFLGAEFTQVYAQMRGRRIQPASNARAIKPESSLPQALLLD